MSRKDLMMRLLSVAILLTWPAEAQSVPDYLQLPALNAAGDSVTVSGYSSGAYETAILSVALSDTFKGAGMIAGGPFDTRVEFRDIADNEGTPADDAIRLVEKMERPSNTSQMSPMVDSLSNLKDQPIYIVSFSDDDGTDYDGVVPSPIEQLRQQEFYEGLGANVMFDRQVQTHYGVYKNNGYGDCSRDSFQRDQRNCIRGIMGNMLEYLTTNLKENPILDWIDGDDDYQSTGVFRPFSQAFFIEGYEGLSDKSSLSPIGYIFYPKVCYEGEIQCRLHVHLHGCGQSARNWGQNGLSRNMHAFNNYAAANNIIVIYPDVQSSEENGLGCWNYWGYNDVAPGRHLSKISDQVKFIKKIVDRVTQPLDIYFDYEENNFYEYDSMDWVQRVLESAVQESVYNAFVLAYQAQLFSVDTWEFAVTKYDEAYAFIDERVFDNRGRCLDIDETVDELGNSCSWYGQFAHNAECGDFDSEDFVANDLCCACGGGRIANRTDKKLSDQFEVDQCTDTSFGRLDDFGDNCSWYADYQFSPWGLLNSSCGAYDNDRFSARDMCCSCGGGTTESIEQQKENQLRAIGVASCTNTHGNMTDDDGFGCDLYDLDSRDCGLYDGGSDGFFSRKNEFASTEMCCSCGGGEVHSCLDGYFYEENSCVSCDSRFANSFLCDAQQIISCKEGYFISPFSGQCTVIPSADLGDGGECENARWMYYPAYYDSYLERPARQVYINHTTYGRLSFRDDDCNFYFYEEDEENEDNEANVNTYGTCELYEEESIIWEFASGAVVRFEYDDEFEYSNNGTTARFVSTQEHGNAYLWRTCAVEDIVTRAEVIDRIVSLIYEIYWVPETGERGPGLMDEIDLSGIDGIEDTREALQNFVQIYDSEIIGSVAFLMFSGLLYVLPQSLLDFLARVIATSFNVSSSLVSTLVGTPLNAAESRYQILQQYFEIYINDPLNFAPSVLTPAHVIQLILILSGASWLSYDTSAPTMSEYEYTYAWIKDSEEPGVTLAFVLTQTLLLGMLLQVISLWALIDEFDETYHYSGWLISGHVAEILFLIYDYASIVGAHSYFLDDHINVLHSYAFQSTVPFFLFGYILQVAYAPQLNSPVAILETLSALTMVLRQFGPSKVRLSFTWNESLGYLAFENFAACLSDDWCRKDPGQYLTRIYQVTIPQILAVWGFYSESGVGHFLVSICTVYFAWFTRRALAWQ